MGGGPGRSRKSKRLGGGKEVQAALRTSRKTEHSGWGMGAQPVL